MEFLEIPGAACAIAAGKLLVSSTLASDSLAGAGGTNARRSITWYVSTKIKGVYHMLGRAGCPQHQTTLVDEGDDKTLLVFAA